MMIRRTIIAFLAGTILLTPAASFAKQKSEPPIVRVSTVINTVKCQLSAILRDPQFTNGMIAPTVKANLSLDNVITKKLDGNAGFEFELIGMTLDGSLAASKKVGTTRSLSLDFLYTEQANGTHPVDCSPEAVLSVEGEPLAEILGSLKNEYLSIRPGNPVVQLKELKYSVTFDVVRETSKGPTIKFLFFKLGGTVTNTRETKNVLSLSFDVSTLPPKFNALIAP